MKFGKKRGISPVIATVLLIVLGLILAMLIFVWAKSVVKEQELKFGLSVSEACKDTQFSADIIGGTLRVNNLGNVPLYGMEIRKVASGKVQKIDTVDDLGGVAPGATKSGTVNGVTPGESGLIAVPIILGETSEYTKPYTCAEEFGEPVEVIS